MRRRHKKEPKQGAVELNLAAMLDMAFQLLTFFILTFRPAPTEGEVALRMPLPQPVAPRGEDPPAGTPSPVSSSDLSSLVVSVSPNAGGGLGTMAIGETPVGGLASLDRQLRTILSDGSNPFEQVVVQVGSDVRYDALMSVIDICTKQKMSNGKPLTKLSFVENGPSVAINTN
jgi:biopolymer transport protein ExbD